MEQINIAGFDRANKSWVTDNAVQGLAKLPKLDGRLLTDEATLNEAADDFGHVRHLRPIAVLEPASVDDIVEIIRFAREHGIKVAARGKGHATFGHSQVEGGIMIKMTALDTPAVVEQNAVTVSAGWTWIRVVAATLKHGLRPPIVTHSPELSVGGTLSVAGIDGGSYRYGAQIDNTLELQVVTGEGRLATCSDTQEPELFNAVLAGMGQCGIIVSAKMSLMPADSHARVFRMYYPDLPSMLHDERLLIQEGRFDRVQGRIGPSPTGKWSFFLVGGKNYTLPAMPDDASLLRGLNFIKESLHVHDSTYFRYVDRSLQFAAAIGTGKFDQPQPWFQSIVPDSVSDLFLGEILSQLTLDEIQEDLPVEIFALNREKFTRPLCRIPDEPLIFGFGCPSRASDIEMAHRMVERNRRFYERARELGCKLYPIGSVRLSHQEWQEQYHPYWEQFSAAKRRYDPDNILTPGPGIFQ
jgi:FAD/FMN-containing dehydrogenase